MAAGAIARLVIPEIAIQAKLVEMGGEADSGRWEAMIEQAKADADSLGGIIECVASGVPAGWGAPVYAKLDAELAGACMGINAVKGVEIGEGFGAARLRGSENAEGMQVSGSMAASRPPADCPCIQADLQHRHKGAARSLCRHPWCAGGRAMVALVLADHVAA